MELRLAHVETTQFRLPAEDDVRRGFLFVTYAVEIEGEAPLICIAEAVDD